MTSRSAAMWDAYNCFHYLCDTVRFQKILMRDGIMRLAAGIEGGIIDAGVFKGVSTIQFAHLLETYRASEDSKVVAFDTFTAEIPHLIEGEAEGANMLMAGFDANAFDALTNAVADLGLAHRVEIVKGDIVKTLPAYLDAHRDFKISILHCDVDTFAATMAILECAWRRITAGGVAVFDNYYNQLWGEAKAVDEFLAALSPAPKIKTLAIGAHKVAYCVKNQGKGGA